MNKKGKHYKKKFIDLDSYTNSCNNDTSENYSNIKSGEEYKTPLEELQTLFPDFPSDLIEDIYISNQRSFNKTKNSLLEMKKEKPIEKDYLFIDINKEYQIENYENIKPFKNKNKNVEDITDLANFKYENYNDGCFETSKEKQEKSIDKNENNECIKENNYEEKKENEEYNNNNNINSKDEKKEKNEYTSVFESELQKEDYITPIIFGDEITIDDSMFDYYINIFKEIFPNYSRETITQRICDNDFDIDKTVLSFFDKGIEKNATLKDLENYKISNEEEILCNFSTFNSFNENNINIEAMIDNNVQKEIEKKIKNKKKNNQIFQNYEKECPSFIDKENDIKSNENNKKEKNEEEYFLDKPINEIKTKEIKNVLKRLSKAFPFEDEFTIKWIYMQFMDYNASYQYLSNKNGNKSKGLKNLINSMNDKNVCYFDDSPPVSKYKEIEEEEEENKANEEEKRNYELLSKILSQNPEKWKLEDSMDKINIKEYQNIRKKLILQAHIAYASRKYQDAQVIMAKARRYKQEINKIMEKKKINLFMKNNKEHAIGNLYNKNEHVIDLHGLSLEESKMIIKKKFNTLPKQKELEDIDKIILVIITGVGKHSKNYKPVLLPGLISWIENKSNYRFKVDENNGIIRVIL